MALMNHSYTKSQMITLAIVFMTIPTIFYSLRVWAKRLVKRFSWDDYLAGAALFICIICCSLQLVTAIYGFLGQHQPQNADGSADLDDPGLIFFEQTKFALNMISIVGLGLVKGSILYFYYTIFPSQKFRYAVYAMVAFVVVWTVSFFFSHLFVCYPITVFLEPYYHNSCVDTIAMFLSLLFTDVFADLAILLLPIPMVLRVQMPWRKKLAVICMLVLGTAVCAVSITRVIATYSIAEEFMKHPNDTIYYTAPVFFWTNIELSLAIVCSCLPTLRPIYVHFFPKPVPRGTDDYEYGSSRRMDAAKNSQRTAYEELDEHELARYGGSTGGVLDQAHQVPGTPEGRDIIKKTTIQQTTEPRAESMTSDMKDYRFVV